MARKSQGRIPQITDEKLEKIQALTNPGYGSNPAETILRIAKIMASKIYYRSGLEHSGIGLSQFMDDLLAESDRILVEYNPDQKPRPAWFNAFVGQKLEWRAKNLLNSHTYSRRTHISKEALEKNLGSGPEKRILLDATEIEAVMKAVDALPEKLRIVVKEYYGLGGTGKGISHAQIGKKRGFSSVTSYRRLQLAHKKLRTGPFSRHFRDMHANMGRARRK